MANRYLEDGILIQSVRVTSEKIQKYRNNGMSKKVLYGSLYPGGASNSFKISLKCGTVFLGKVTMQKFFLTIFNPFPG